MHCFGRAALKVELVAYTFSSRHLFPALYPTTQSDFQQNRANLGNVNRLASEGEVLAFLRTFCLLVERVRLSKDVLTKKNTGYVADVSECVQCS